MFFFVLAGSHISGQKVAPDAKTAPFSFGKERRGKNKIQFTRQNGDAGERNTMHTAMHKGWCTR